MWEGQVRRSQTACHKAIRDVAQAAAGELYESFMRENEVYAEWKRQNPGLTAKQLETRFIAKNWGKCIEFARATLAHMLTRPDIAESVKDNILEVLILDNSIPVGRTPPTRSVQIGNLAQVAREQGWRP